MLTPEMQQALAAYINKKWAGTNCRLCGQNNWSTEGFISVSIAPFGRGMVYGGPSMPMVAVICMNCGNTVFINAVIAGLMPVPPSGEAGA